MGQSQGKESRDFDGSEGPGASRDRRGGGGEGSGDAASRTARSRMSRSDLSFLGIGNNSTGRGSDRADGSERRETRQEREARRQEKERAAREKERERSLREEHVDGGYLVTLGTYVGSEDFSKTVVRQLQVERKLAPFWRGLNDWSDSWAEHQLVAAARGLPVPAADDPPDPDLIPRPPPMSSSSSNLQSLTVPMGPRTMSAASDRSGSNVGSSAPSPSSAAPGRSSPFKPRAKALAAALSVGSRNTSSTDLAPKEIQLPKDPFVNGQPIEVFLYKDATECPICFLTYPPYLNQTRCCEQPICSECFVQIKRAEPHLPEHHPDGEVRDPNAPLQPEDPPEMLISEPTACPYCQQPEFGVTYDPPPFRRGLTYSSSQSNLHSTAMSSQSSLNSTVPTSPTQPNRRRGHSLSANAPNVITTDRVRPDWATKLAAARAHQARRAAAATALHTAAFLIGGNESRSILRPGRFSRRNTGNNNVAGGGSDGRQASTAEDAEGSGEGTQGSGRRRNRMAELEEMMLAEAVRLSIAAEADRQRKEEKALRKEAKKKLKEERKALKKQGSDPYSGGTSGASGSSLSLGLGRRRGNSAASNLRMEATVQGASSAVKGSETPPEAASSDGKGKGVDRGTGENRGESASPATSLPIPTSTSRGGSHLRQMSNASSIGSSLADSPSGSYTGQGFTGPDGSSSQAAGTDVDAGPEPLFNFRSLAEMVGVNLEDGSSTLAEGEEQDVSHGRPLSRVNEEDDKEGTNTEHVEEATKQGLNAPNATRSASDLPTPELMVTPETPAPDDALAGEQKQLGHSSVSEKTTHVAP